MLPSFSMSTVCLWIYTISIVRQKYKKHFNLHTKYIPISYYYYFFSLKTYIFRGQEENSVWRKNKKTKKTLNKMIRNRQDRYFSGFVKNYLCNPNNPWLKNTDLTDLTDFRFRFRYSIINFQFSTINSLNLQSQIIPVFLIRSIRYIRG